MGVLYLAARLVGLSLVLLAGCDSAPAPPASAPPDRPIIVEAPKFQAPDPAATSTSAVPQPAAAPADDVVRERATSAQTAKGKYEVDLFTQPVSAYFTVKDQVVFQVQIPKALQLFDLTKNRKPASHEEFMTEIIERIGIKLPELQPNHRYVYDPKRGELLVERPK